MDVAGKKHLSELLRCEAKERKGNDESESENFSAEKEY